MEARIGSGSRHFYGQDSPDFVMKERNLMGIGKRSTEWNMDDWKWDGDLFLASPLNSVPLDCRSKQFIPLGLGNPAGGILSNSSSSCSDEVNAEEGKGKGELEKRRRVVVVEEDEPHEEAGPLTLKLGGHVYPIMESDFLNWEEKNGKKTQMQGPSSSRSVCQVEGCGADLSNARDYHRRHKVCEMHSKATNALVGNVMQRFCQQCSRFHILQEFDEGKRSCRRRLAGHNRRRRKTHPDAVVGGNSLNDDRASSYLLITLLRILSNLHCNYLYLSHHVYKIGFWTSFHSRLSAGFSCFIFIMPCFYFIYMIAFCELQVFCRELFSLSFYFHQAAGEVGVSSVVEVTARRT